MEQIHFQARLEKDKDGTWWYVHVPIEIRQQLKHLEKRGIIPVVAKIGGSVWNGSLLPWVDGSAQLSVKKDTRKKENLELDKMIDVYISPRC